MPLRRAKGGETVTDPLFKVHRLNEKGMEKAQKLAANFEELNAFIESLNPAGGRELAIARTKLEEACFFAKKAIAQHPENQE